MQSKTKINIFRLDSWIRAVYMILFGFLSFISRFIVLVICFLQFILVLLTGELNRNLKSFGERVSIWTYQAFLFLTYNTDEKPYPFSDWPEVTPIEKQVNIDELSGDQDIEVPTFVKKNEEKIEV